MFALCCTIDIFLTKFIKINYRGGLYILKLALKNLHEIIGFAFFPDICYNKMNSV